MCTVHVKPALCLHCPAYNKGMHMSDAEPFWLLQVNAEQCTHPLRFGSIEFGDKFAVPVDHFPGM